MSAPGKLFVTGEYGVVAGGPAVVAAVSRRLRVRARARRGSGHVYVRRGAESVRCSFATERFDDLPADVRFVAGAAVVAARTLELREVDVEIDTESELDRGTEKTGLGGSAAVSAATVAALHALAGRRLDDERGARERAATAVYAHRLVQGGGSGADVVCCTVGGLVWTAGLDGRDVPRDVSDCVRRVRETPPPRFTHLTLPNEFALEMVATGTACATGPRVARFVAKLSEDETSAASLRAWTAGMAAAVDAFRDGCASGDPARVLGALHAAGRLLERLGAVTSIRIFNPALRRASAVGRALGAVVKPSGAGGGDCAIAIVPDGLRERLRAAWREAGLQPLDATLDTDGARLEETR
ncbi:MAG TPA: hypothetical protein VIS07_16915 [Candidatus Binatia bacterium]